MPVLTSLVGLVMLQGGWKPYSALGFTVAFPVKPKFSRISKTGIEILEASNVKGANLFVAVVPPRTVVSKSADVAIADTLDRTLPNSRVFLQVDVLVDGWPGVRYTAERGDGSCIVGCVVFAKEHLIDLTSIGMLEKSLDPGLRMISSLRLPKGFGRGPYKKAGPDWKRYPIGSTGMSAEFPRPPAADTAPEEETSKRESHLLSAEIINRVYSIDYVTFPGLENSTEAQDDATLKAFCANGAKKFGPNPTEPQKIGSRGRNVWRSTVATQDGKAALRFESMRQGKWLIRFVSCVPTCLTDSPEVERFFASAKVD